MRHALVLLLALCLAACAREAPNFEETSIADLHDAMQRGDLRAEELVHWYLDRIEALDRNGPELRSLIEVNPDALTIARSLDDEWRKSACTPARGRSRSRITCRRRTPSWSAACETRARSSLERPT
jgi:hypothetical protein